MDKELWYIYTMEHYSAIKRNASESALIRWMNLEPITQSEVCQKEKDKYYVLTYVWNLDDTDAFICKAAMEKQT